MQIGDMSPISKAASCRRTPKFLTDMTKALFISRCNYILNFWDVTQ
jgi:hypothetical protein